MASPCSLYHFYFFGFSVFFCLTHTHQSKELERRNPLEMKPNIDETQGADKIHGIGGFALGDKNHVRFGR